MGLFDKKYCDICGDKIGLLGNKKIKDGNMCKNCAKKLSPLFDERRDSTLEQIKDHLAYRERNKDVLAAFNPTRTIGKNCKLIYVDEPKRQFVVARKIDDGENHDVIQLSQVTSCYMDLDEHRTEEKRTDSEGKSVSYNPPRYKYSYDYYVYIMVNSPYFNEIKIKVNNFQVKQDDHINRHSAEKICREMVSYMNQATGLGTGNNMSIGMGVGMGQGTMNRQYQGASFGAGLVNQFFDQVEMNRMKEEQRQMNQGYANQGYQHPVQQTVPWFCQNCGAQNNGRFCENCGSPRQ